MKAHIHVVYHAEIVIPNDFYEKYGHTKEYEQQSYAAGALVSASGQDNYSDVTEWGEGPTREECEAFIASWKQFVEKEVI